MQRFEHPAGWRPPPGKAYYFRYWDRCRPCEHIQLYEIAKTPAPVDTEPTTGRLFDDDDALAPVASDPYAHPWNPPCAICGDPNPTIVHGSLRRRTAVKYCGFCEPAR